MFLISFSSDLCGFSPAALLVDYLEFICEKNSLGGTNSLPGPGETRNGLVMILEKNRPENVAPLNCHNPFVIRNPLVF